jgi:hypothetical protein
VLAATAIAHVRARYTKAAMCAATLAVYAELLDATQPGPGAEPDP